MDMYLKSKSNTVGIFYLLLIREVIRVNPKSKVKPKPPACHIYTQVDNSHKTVTINY